MIPGAGDLAGCLRCAPVRRRSDPPDDTVREDAFFDLVTNRRRRECLRYLLSADDDAATIDELVEHLFDVETDDPDADDVVDRRKSIYVSLRQTHLPRLDRHDVVDFDATENVVRPDENLDAFAELAEPAPATAANDDPMRPSLAGRSELVVLALLTVCWLLGVTAAVFGSSLVRTVVVTAGYVGLAALIHVRLSAA